MPVLNATLVSADQPPLEKGHDNVDPWHDLVSRIGTVVDNGDLVLLEHFPIIPGRILS